MRHIVLAITRNHKGPSRDLVSAADEGGDPPCWAHLHTGDGDAGDADTHTPAFELSDSVLARMVRDLADAVIVADGNGVIQFWNAAATRVFGWSADEALGRTLDLIVPERWRERHWAGYDRVMATGHTEYGDRLLEVPANHLDGHMISIAFTVTLLRDASGKPEAIAAVVRDDTERRRTLRALEDELGSRRGEAGSHEPASATP
jgi:PAS domain S-box-containing protein